MDVCRGCEAPIEQPVTGRRRIWCSEECRRAQRNDRLPADRKRTVEHEPMVPVVAALVDALDLPEDDAARLMGRLALDLALELDANPGNVVLMRELRLTATSLAAAAPRASRADGEVDADRVEFLARRAREALR